MYERFTDRARKVTMLADQEARRLGSPSLAPEHILLGLLKEGSGVAAHVLGALGVSTEAIVQSLEAGTTPTPPVPHDQPERDRSRSRWWLLPSAMRRLTISELPTSPESKTLIAQALTEARSLGHNYVGTEHLLLGLLAQPDSRAAQLLLDKRLTLDKVRQEVLDLLGQGM
ncbi:MAG TPA: Clp protease N-terminal domain-containing protein [Pirellulales bacterium]|nr:Clp protease N-terminal domain-containing protein [Pirellulales bacterium]